MKFGKDFPYSEKRAAARTKSMFTLARKYPRLKRIYVYRWFGEPRSSRFDAGLVDPDGSARQHGRIPRDGSEIAVTGFRYGGGAGGNVGARTLTALRSSVPYISGCVNLRAQGGGQPEGSQPDRG